jgi:hypothetical protein
LGQSIGDRPLLIIGAILVLAGLQLISLGLLAEMQLRTYYEARDQRPYQVRHVHEAITDVAGHSLKHHRHE